MQPIVIAASPLTYAEYKKLCHADLRIRYPYFYIGLPIFSIIPLIIIAILIADKGIALVEWQTLRTLLLPSGISVIVWLTTWYSLRRNYKQSKALENGTIYRLDEQMIIRESTSLEMVTWSDIAKTAKQYGQWILLRQAATTSGEIYFLNAASVMPPANRADLLELLKRKRIKRVWRWSNLR